MNALELKSDLLLSSYFTKNSTYINKKDLKIYVSKEDKEGNRISMEVKHGYSEYFDFSPILPSSPVVFDMSSDRLYTGSEDMLIIDPIAELEKGIETASIFEGVFTWVKMILCRKKPKMINTFGRAFAWVEVHVRNLDEKGNEDYFLECYPVNRKGVVMPYKIEGWNLSDDYRRKRGQVIARCSMLEDYNRAGAIKAKAEIEDGGLSIRFPLEQGKQKEFFKLRDAPRETPTGRLNPIIHFCSDHIRNRNGETVKVSGHWRGREKITIDGMTLTLECE